MNNNLKNNSNIISLYKFIQEFCKIRSKIIINDNDYIWNCKIDNIEDDPENISIKYCDQLEDGDDDELDYILRVHKPEFQNAPELPKELKGWISGEWNDYKDEVKIIKEREKNSLLDDIDDIEKFDDDPKRKIIAEEYLNKRNEWVKSQKKVEKTRKLFTDLYMIYNDLKKDSETIEIIVANGYIKDRNNPNIYHPILTKSLNMNFDAVKNIIYVTNTDTRSELYTELFQMIDNISLEALSSLNTKLMHSDYHPMDRNNTKDFLKVLVHMISSDSKFIDEGEIDDGNNRISMFYRPSIIVRKRLDGTVKAIDKIIKNIEET